MNESRTRRRGSMLVELMVVIPMVATLLVLTVGWIHQSLNLASSLCADQRQHQHLLMLERQFRDDVHRAADVQLDAPASLVITREDATEVTYQLSRDRITRRWRHPQRDPGERPDAASDGREDFELADGSRPRWDTTEMPQWIALVIERPRADLSGEKRGNRSPIISATGGNDLHVTDLHVRADAGRLRSLGVATVSEAPIESVNSSESEAQDDRESVRETSRPSETNASGANETESDS